MKRLTRYGIALAAIAALPIRADQAPSGTDAQREQVRANFLAADADGDGALTRQEFTRLIDLNAQHDIGRARMIARFNRYDRAFGRADTKADGGVTREELSAFAEQER